MARESIVLEQDEREVAQDARIVDLTAKANRRKRSGRRDPKTIDALVLHQMACCFKPKAPLTRFLTVGAHFAITHDGRILQLHPVTELVWASNGLSRRSVAVEFAGNFPNARGTWWEGAQFGRNRPTAAQFEAGRYLIQHLVRTVGIRHVFAHRQSSGTRTNDPGPEIWANVGQWAVDTLGLSDGGAGFKDGTGAAIPGDWRTPRPAPVAREMEIAWDAESPDTEIAHDVWNREEELGDPEYVRWVQRSLNEVMNLRLPVDGVMVPALRSAVRTFQRRRALPITGLVGTETEEELKATRRAVVDREVADAQRIALRAVPGMPGTTVKDLVERWRRTICPEIPWTILLAFMKKESGGNFEDATHGTEKNGWTSPPFYELGLFQTPAGSHGLCTSRDWRLCASPPPGEENPRDPSPWTRLCARIGADPKQWTNPTTQVRVGLMDLELGAVALRKAFPELFPKPGSEWDLRMAVLYRFARGGGYARSFLTPYRGQLAAMPEAQRWGFLRDKVVTVPAVVRGKRITVRREFQGENVDAKMTLAAKLGAA